MLRTLLPDGRRGDVAIGLLVVAGLATFANAFTPEDVTLTGDTVTAIIAFLCADFSLIQIGRSTSAGAPSRGYRLLSIALGATGIAALTLDGFGLGTVIGEGTIEWLIVGPFLIWAPATGIRLILEK